MMIAALIAAVGILIDSPILIVGAMVVGPEFGPIAGFCVAIVQRRGDLAARSATALAVGTAAAIVATVAWSLFFKWTGIDSDGPGDVRPLTEFISNPDFFSFFVAYLAGTAGVLSLTSAKSGALIGVLISVTTIPAIANIGVETAYTDWAEVGGAGGAARGQPRRARPGRTGPADRAASRIRGAAETSLERLGDGAVKHLREGAPDRDHRTSVGCSRPRARAKTRHLSPCARLS